MTGRPPAKETGLDVTDAPAATEDPRGADYGNGVAALRALRDYEPKGEGERVLVEAVRALSRTAVGIDRRMNQGFIDLKAHVDSVVEELRCGIDGVAATNGKLAASADSVQELLALVRGIDAHVRGLPNDRPSSPETPSAKHRVSAVTAVDPDVARTGDDP
jgi:hypothetical protein